jgi:hypothetical protein
MTISELTTTVLKLQAEIVQLNIRVKQLECPGSSSPVVTPITKKSKEVSKII